MTSAASERQIRKRREQARYDAAATDLTIRAIMATQHGRRWMWLQLASTYCFLANNHTEPVAFGRQEGARQIGLQLLGQVQRICPREYMTMTTENTGVQLEQNDDDRSQHPDADADPEQRG